MKTQLRFYLIFVILLINTYSFAQFDILFKEDFKNNKNFWQEYNDKNNFRKVTDNSYIIENKLKKGAIESLIKLDDINRDTLIIKTTISKLNGPENLAFGLVWGSDKTNRFSFVISGEGKYSIDKLNNNKYHDFVKWTKSKHLKLKNKANTLKIHKLNDTLKFYINDKYICKHKIDTLFGNYIGYTVSSKVKIKVENLTLKGKVKFEEPTMQAFPPDLVIEKVYFNKIKINKRDSLQALSMGQSEVAKVSLTIKNKGRGKAFHIEAIMTLVGKDTTIKVSPPHVIQKLESGESDTLSFNIETGKTTPKALRDFKIRAIEYHGFDAIPYSFKAETKVAQPADLQILIVAIDDKKDLGKDAISYGNGNSKIEPNETIEVFVYLINRGNGITKNATAKIILNTNSKNIVCPEANKEIKLGNIKKNDKKLVQFYFYTNRRFESTKIPIILKVNDGKKNSNIDLNLSMNKKIINFEAAKKQINKVINNKKEVIKKEINKTIEKQK